MSSERIENLADGESFSKPELKSRLHQMDVEFNVNKQNKTYFVELYREAIQDPAKREKIRERLDKDPNQRGGKRRGQESDQDHRTTFDVPSKQPKLNAPEEEKNQGDGSKQVHIQKGPLISNVVSENQNVRPGNEIIANNSPSGNRLFIAPTVTTARVRIPGDYRNYNSTGQNNLNLNINNIPHKDTLSPKQNKSVFNINDIFKQTSPINKSPNEKVEVSGNSLPKVSTSNLIKIASSKSNSGNINQIPLPNEEQIPSNGVKFNPLPSNAFNPTGSTFSFGAKFDYHANNQEFNNQIKIEADKQFTELKKEVIYEQPHTDIQIDIIAPNVTNLSPKTNPNNLIINGGENKQPSPSTQEIKINNVPIAESEPGSTTNTNLSVNKLPPIRPFRGEEDKWSISRHQAEESQKPFLTIQMLVKYFLTGVVCSVMFFGIYYCIQNCPEIQIDWNLSHSQEKVLNDIPGKVAETVNPRSINYGLEEGSVQIQEESYLHYLWTFFVSGAENTKWALTHPKSFMLDVILSGLKYVAYEWLWYWFKNNFWYLLGILTLKMIAYKSYKLIRDRLNANQAFKKVKSKLKDIYESGSSEGMTEEEIIKNLSKEYNIHEEHFKDHIMPRLKSLRQNDKEVKICYYNAQERPRMIWKYTNSY